MSWITKIALKKRWLTILIASLVAAASIWATLTLKMELIPDIELPMTTVITVHPQAQAEEVMDEVTIPIEAAIADISGLEHIISTSGEGSSVVFAQFAYGTNMDEVNRIIGERLESLELPPQVTGLPAMMPGLDENPRLFPLDINMLPVVIQLMFTSSFLICQAPLQSALLSLPMIYGYRHSLIMPDTRFVLGTLCI